MAMLMQGSGDELLAGAGLTINKDSEGGGAEAADGVKYRENRWIRAYEVNGR